jgi:hypothetical protein
LNIISSTPFSVSSLPAFTSIACLYFPLLVISSQSPLYYPLYSKANNLIQGPVGKKKREMFISPELIEIGKLEQELLKRSKFGNGRLIS